MQLENSRSNVLTLVKCKHSLNHLSDMNKKFLSKIMKHILSLEGLVLGLCMSLKVGITKIEDFSLVIHYSQSASTVQVFRIPCLCISAYTKETETDN